MKFGYHALRWGWQKLSLSTIADGVSKAGFKGFEIICGDGVWGKKGDFLPFAGDTKKVLDVLSGKEAKVASIYNFGKYILGVDYNFLEIPKHFLWRRWQIPKAAKFVESIGCKKFIFGGGYPRFKRKEDMREKDYQQMASLLNHVGKICTDYGLRVTYHPHPEPHPYTIQTREQIDKLFDLVDPDLINLSLDTGLSAGGMDLVEVIQTYRGRIGHVHFKDYKDGDFFDLGEGAVNFPLVLETLRSAGYDDWVIIEDWYPPLTSRDPFESAKKSRKYLEKHLAAQGDIF
jgi:inosose dehydratase